MVSRLLLSIENCVYTDLGPIIADSSLARNSPLIFFKMSFSSA